VFVVCCLVFVVWCLLFENEGAREPGKTRGAIVFDLIFLCFVSLYQDKEMKNEDICFMNAKNYTMLTRVSPRYTRDN
jgi:hypothetical protein